MEAALEADHSSRRSKPSKVSISVAGWSTVTILVVFLTLTVVEEYQSWTSEEIHARLSGVNGRGGGGLRKLGMSGRAPKRDGFRVKMLHRNSVDSPYRNEYASKLEALVEDIAIDAARLAAIRHQQRRSSSNNDVGVQTVGDDGNSPPNLPPNLTAVVDGSPSNDLDFQSRLVSGSTLGSGQYFVDFQIGTPPQSFHLIVDTGSDLLWVQCAPCRSCYAQDGPVFQPLNSSTFAPVPCSAPECFLIDAPLGAPCAPSPGIKPLESCAYEYRYGDNSSTVGVFGYDSATIGEIRVNHLAFGCGNANQGPSFEPAGGILGLGQGPLSLASQFGYAFSNKFAYCLVNYLSPTSISSSLIFGDELTSTIHDLQFTPLVTNTRSPSSYYVQVRGICIEGEALHIPETTWEIDPATGNGGSVFDSGFTVTYWRPEAYRAIIAAFERLVHYPRVAASDQGLELCVDISGVEHPRYPTFAVEFDHGAVLSPHSENYFVEVDPSGKVQCLAMLEAAPSGFNTIGNLMQQNFLVQYDRDESRIGFAPAHCDQ